MATMKFHDAPPARTTEQAAAAEIYGALEPATLFAGDMTDDTVNAWTEIHSHLISARRLLHGRMHPDDKR